MEAIREWRYKIAACRRGRTESYDEMWERTARWYDNWVAHSDYVTLVWPHLCSRLSSSARVLEVGPGSGAFTLPLAYRVKEIAAVEPSYPMREVLSCKLSEAHLTNVHLIPRRVEDAMEALEGPFDLAFASHSLFDVESIDSCVRGLLDLAPHLMILMGTGERRAWVETLHDQFKGKARRHSPQFPCFYRILLDMGIYADVKILNTSSNYVYDNDDALVEAWMSRLRLNESRREELRDALLPIAERRGEHIGIYSHHRMALISVDRERSVFRLDGD